MTQISQSFAASSASGKSHLFFFSYILAGAGEGLHPFLLNYILYVRRTKSIVRKGNAFRQ